MNIIVLIKEILYQINQTLQKDRQIKSTVGEKVIDKQIVKSYRWIDRQGLGREIEGKRKREKDNDKEKGKERGREIERESYGEKRLKER